MEILVPKAAVEMNLTQNSMTLALAVPLSLVELAFQTFGTN